MEIKKALCRLSSAKGVINAVPPFSQLALPQRLLSKSDPVTETIRASLLLSSKIKSLKSPKEWGTILLELVHDFQLACSEATFRIPSFKPPRSVFPQQLSLIRGNPYSSSSSQFLYDIKYSFPVMFCQEKMNLIILLLSFLQ